MPSAAQSPFDHRQRHDVETPEQVVVGLELAGLGSRVLAAVIDHAILAASFAVLAALGTFLGILGAGLPAAGLLLVSLALLVLFSGYFVFFETMRGGQTPGKRLVGIRVVDASGRGLTAGAAVLRNLLRLADLLPGPYAVGMLAVALHPRNQRLGDMVADTLVVRDRPAERVVPPAPGAEAGAIGTVAARSVLADGDVELLGRVVARAAELEPAARQRVLDALVARVGTHLDGRGDLLGQLERLHARERAARQLGLARSSPLAGAERLARTKEERWTAFEALAARAARGGLDELPPGELVDFAARYRELAADLARARTYGASAFLLHRLERLVGAGHAALYRDDAAFGARLRRFVFLECPRTLLARWRPIGAAVLVFGAPLAAGFALIRERPALASTLVNGTMLERAEAAEARRARGEGYITTTAGERPTMALAIIANNVRVAYTCFAGGIFLGVGALVLLFLNGLTLGTSAGHFANVGALDYLGEFVVGHGPLELLAICIAGAAGFLLGAALVAPGNRTRRDALVLAGRDALRLVTVATLMLIVAGLIEGLVSASGTGWGVRLSCAAAGVGLLLLYLGNGLAGRVTPSGASPASASPTTRSPGGR